LQTVLISLRPILCVLCVPLWLNYHSRPVHSLRRAAFPPLVGLLISTGIVAAVLADKPTGVAALVPVLKQVDDPDFQLDILKGMAAGLKGKRQIDMPAGWPEVAAKLEKSPKSEVRDLSQRLSILFGDQATIAQFRKLVADAKAETKDRESALATLLSIKDAELPPLLQELLVQPTLARAALKGLAAYGRSENGRFDSGCLSAIGRNGQAGRPGDACDAGSLRATTLGRNQESKNHADRFVGSYHPATEGTRQHGNRRSNRSVLGNYSHFIRRKKQEIEKFKILLKSPPASEINLSRGRALFVKTCQQCHTLFV